MDYNNYNTEQRQFESFVSMIVTFALGIIVGLLIAAIIMF